MNIIITGAGGFLGRSLLKKLADNNSVTVIALTSQKEELQLFCADSENIVISEKDMLFDRKLLLTKEDIFINCAFPRNTDGVQMADGLSYIQRVLETAVEMGVGAVINISSQSVYSQTRECAADEDTCLNLESKYAVGKYAAELLTNSICKNIPHTNLRMASLIGPQFGQRVTNKMARAAFLNQKLVLKEGKQYFGFMDVEDAARGIVEFIFSEPSCWSECYNFGTDQAYSLRNIAECIAESFLKMGLGEVDISVEPTDEIRNTSLDCKKIKKEIGFEAKVSLQESINRIITDMLKKQYI